MREYGLNSISVIARASTYVSALLNKIRKNVDSVSGKFTDNAAASALNSRIGVKFVPSADFSKIAWPILCEVSPGIHSAMRLARNDLGNSTCTNCGLPGSGRG